MLNNSADGRNHNVVFYGYLSTTEKVKLLSQSHLFVHPSSKEGWGTTIVEANACGSVAIGFNVPGIKEVIINRETGYLIEYNDIDLLSSRCIELINNKKLYSQIRSKAVNFVERFDEKRTIDSASSFIIKYLTS